MNALAELPATHTPIAAPGLSPEMEARIAQRNRQVAHLKRQHERTRRPRPRYRIVQLKLWAYGEANVIESALRDRLRADLKTRNYWRGIDSDNAAKWLANDFAECRELVKLLRYVRVQIENAQQ